MNLPCEEIQAELAEHGVEALRQDPAAAEHVAGCEACADVLFCLEALDARLLALPAQSPPDSLTAAVLARIAGEGDELELDAGPVVEATTPAPPRLARSRRLRPPRLRFLRSWRTLAAAAAVLLGLLSSTWMLRSAPAGKVSGLFETADQELDGLAYDTPSRSSAARPAAAPPPSFEPPPPKDRMIRPGEGGKNMSDVFRPETRKRVQSKRDSAKQDGFSIAMPGSRRRDRGASMRTERGREGEGERRAEVEQAATEEAWTPLATPAPSAKPNAEVADDVQRGRLEEEVAAEGLLALIGAAGGAGSAVDSSAVPDLLSDASQLSDDVGEALANSSGLSVGRKEKKGNRADAPEEAAELEWAADGVEADGEGGEAGRARPAREHSQGIELPRSGEAAPAADEQHHGPYRRGPQLDSEARSWLDDLEDVGVRTREARGYWANTYLPGDTEMRRLRHRLDRWDRSGLPAGLTLEGAATQPDPPFDPPRNSALGLQVHADRGGVEGESRVRVAVSLQGTPRRAGHRPAMNIGVVLDLRASLTDEIRSLLRSFLFALAEQQDLGDTISVTVAGRAGASSIPAGAFRYGTVEVLLRDLEQTDDEPALSLPDAFDRARLAVGDLDDPTAPLGSSLVWLVTPRSLPSSLVTSAHESAVDGVPVSVLELGSGGVPGLDEVALQGQGSLRQLSHPDSADAITAEELARVGRVVARAVRLRVRLAPGVRLVNVLGSRRLDEVQAEQVRQAEKSIDVRVSRNLGIVADRGEDEDGIQIVVPAWYAGDSHAFLIDVVVPGPGPVLDVTARFKDLVKLGNGVARAGLDLDRDPSVPGPLQLAVHKAVLAWHISGELQAAASDGPDSPRLPALRRRIRGVLSALPGLAADPEVLADLTMVDDFVAASQSVRRGQTWDRLSDSLRYAGLRKTLPPPDTD